MAGCTEWPHDKGARILWRAARIERTEDFEAAFAQALQPGAPMLIHVKLDADVITSRSTLSAMRAAALLAGR